MWPFSARKNCIELFTDGSHKAGLGAWAFVAVSDGKIISESYGTERKTSSLRMEIRAVIEALKFIGEDTTAALYSDCRILVDEMSREPGSRRGPVSELYEVIDGLAASRKITWHWVQAHSGIPFNERCDQLCLSARQKRLQK